MAEPKIVLWDIETSFSVVTTFQLKTDYIGHENILQDWNILSASWKYLGEDKIYNVHVGKDVTDDRKIIEKVHKVISDADILIGHNGDKFDLKKFNTRVLYHKLPPLPRKILTIDTLKEAKKHFAFSSNRLDYLGQFLGIGKKMDTPKGLWHAVLRGDKGAIQAMAEYNNHDVYPLLEEVYLRLRPYIDHPNMGAYFNDDVPRCVNCGHNDMIKHGTRPTKEGNRYQRYYCQNCGASAMDRTLLSKPILKGG